MDDEPRLSHTLLEILGHFVRCERFTQEIINSFTSRLPEGMPPAVLKPRLSTNERLRALNAVLKDRGWAIAYAEISPLWREVVLHRDKIAHRDIIPTIDDSEIYVQSWAPAGAAPEVWSRAKINALRVAAERLEGLITSVMFELEIANTRSSDDDAWITGFDAIGHYEPDEPRRPYRLPRRPSA